MREFPWNQYGVSDEHRNIAHRYIGFLLTPPDLVIAPDGKPYIYRWHCVKAHEASVYFHIQVADDPERPLHDHPWENMSVILAGGYREVLNKSPTSRMNYEKEFIRGPGDVIFRKAAWAHRLFMPEGVPYTMSQFSCGPKVRKWGFWFEDGWRPYTDVTETHDGMAVHTGRK